VRIASVDFIIALTESSLTPIPPRIESTFFGNSERMIITSLDFNYLLITQCRNQCVMDSVFFISKT